MLLLLRAIAYLPLTILLCHCDQIKESVVGYAIQRSMSGANYVGKGTLQLDLALEADEYSVTAPGLKWDSIRLNQGGLLRRWSLTINSIPTGDPLAPLARLNLDFVVPPNRVVPTSGVRATYERFAGAEFPYRRVGKTLHLKQSEFVIERADLTLGGRFAGHFMLVEGEKRIKGTFDVVLADIPPLLPGPH